MQTHIKKLVSFSLFLVIFGILALSVMADVLTLTVRPGRPAIASGRVNNDDNRYYEVQLSKKNSLTIELEGSATFDFVARDGKAIATGVNTWEDRIPADGWYDITVKTNGGSQEFKLTLTAYENQPAAASPSRNPNQSPAPAQPSQVDVTGAYFPVGDLPEDFSEIQHLALATIDDQSDPAPLNGFLRPKRRSAKDYRLVDVKLVGNELSFSTTRVGRVSYSFKGKFLVLGNFAQNPPAADKVVLQGELLKMIDGGAPVAGTNVSFTYSNGG